MKLMRESPRLRYGVKIMGPLIVSPTMERSMICAVVDPHVV